MREVEIRILLPKQPQDVFPHLLFDRVSRLPVTVAMDQCCVAERQVPLFQPDNLPDADTKRFRGVRIAHAAVAQRADDFDALEFFLRQCHSLLFHAAYYPTGVTFSLSTYE